MKRIFSALLPGCLGALLLVCGTLSAQYVPQPPQPDQAPSAQGPSNPGLSQQTDDVNENGDNPKRGVARVSIVQGEVNVKRGDAGEVVAAAINAPMFAQDRLQTSEGSRAEVQLDYANVIRLAPNTDIGIADLQYHKYQLQLGTGTVIYRVLRNFNSQAELDTPNVSARPSQPGEYRISVLEDGTTEITVRAGELEVFSAQGSQRLRSGSTMLVRGAENTAEFQTVAALGLDQFDDWSQNRDHQLLSSRSYAYVNPDVYGADELDSYGSWVSSEYGSVWAPRDINPGWAPYSNGHWGWTPYYGWSWTDYAPWGWAPFHYGNWFWNTGYNGWCWYPGARYGSQFWHPALVGFVGFGRGGLGFGVGFGGGFGSFGWVPLAPFERFRPWYGRGYYGGGFGRGINNLNITNVYRNARFNGAVHTAASNGFGGINQRFGTVTQGQLRGASLVQGGLPTPNRGSYQYSNRTAVANPRFSSASNHQYFQASRASAGRAISGSNNAGNATGFRSFSGANPGSTSNRSAVNQSQSGALFGNPQSGSHGVPPNMRTASGFQNAGPRTAGQGGWHAFGDPGATTAARAGANSFQRSAGTATYGAQSGWHRFGDPEQTQGNRGTSYNSGNYNSRPLAPAQAAQRSSQGYSNGYSGNYRNGFSAGSSANGVGSNSYRPSSAYNGASSAYSSGGYSRSNSYAQPAYRGSTPSSSSSRQPAASGSTRSYGSGGGSNRGGGGGSSSSHGSSSGGGSHSNGGGGGGHHGR